MGVSPDRWLLEAAFDSIRETMAAGAYEGGPGEAQEFYDYLREYWDTGVPEDLDDLVELDGDTVRASAEVLDYLAEPLAWLLMHAVPKRVTLERQVPR